jgi:hypothetical protein
MDGDAIYFGRRAREEREAALKCSHPRARQSHLDLAERYDELASAIRAHQPQLADAIGADRHHLN